MRLTKRLTAFLLTLALAFSLCPAASAAIVEPFEDVPADAYYAPAVEWALAAGVTDGIAPTRFGPDYTVTRGQAVTFLWRAMGQPEPEDTQCPFNDVNAGDYFYDPVLWAVENGITDGTSDTTFSPADTLTRAHIITFIWRTAGWPNDNGSELWYTDAVNWAQKEDLLSGTARAFAPGDPCPRADVVTYLYRANEAGFLYWDGDCRYEFVLDDCSWTEAFENALDAGGHLVRIETPEEYEIILSEIAKRGMENVQFRIGARRDSSSEEYRWVDDNNQLIGDVLNSPGSWIAPLWEAGEPSFRWAGNEETVLEIEFIPDFQDWQWNDIQDWVPTASGGNNLGYIIEYDYEDYEDLFDVPVEEMNDAQMLDAMDEWIDLDEDGLKDEDGYIALADWPELMEYMVDSAECLKEEGLLTAYSYSEEDAYILYTLRSGLWVLYKPPIRENQGLAGAPVSTIEPNRNEDKYSVKGKDFADHAGEATQLQKTITDLGIGYTAGSQLVNDDATLSEIIQCLDNSADGIVLWFSHGHWTEETGPGLRTGEKYNESKHKAMRDAKEIAVNEDTGTIFVLAPFFENHLRDNALKSSLVVLGACKSIRDTSLADAFLSKGADCVVGSKEDFVISKLFNNAADFIDALTTQKDDGSYTTVREALNKVNSNPVNILQVGSGKFEAVFGDWWHLYNTVSGNVTITGTVIDGNTKKPIVGATVTCESHTIKTDANGEFSISGLSEYALHTVIANYSEYEENSVTIDPNDTWNATISLYPAGAIDLYVDAPFLVRATAELYETDGSLDAEAIITEKKPIRQGSGSDIKHWLMTGLYNGQEYLISVGAIDYPTQNVFVKAALEPEETHITLRKPSSNLDIPVVDAAVSYGYDHMAKLMTDGSLWTWGKNDHGQLGDGTKTESTIPLKVLDNVVAVSCGVYYTAAIQSDGSLWTWGTNLQGQLGDGTTSSSTKPIKVLDDVTAVSCRDQHAAAILTDGSLWTWGFNYFGELGDGTQKDSYIPIKVMDNAIGVSCGKWFMAAIQTDGSLWTWGYNYYGQLGNGNHWNSNVPVKVLEDVAVVSCGSTHMAAIQTDGSLWTWGKNDHGQLGDGTTTDSSIPIKVLDNVAAVSCGNTFMAVILDDGSLWAWGTQSTGIGMFSHGTNSDYTVPVKILDHVTTVSCGSNNAAAILDDGSLVTWPS